MWVAKIRMDGQGASIGSLCKKYNISAYGYPISLKSSKESVVCHFVMVLKGEESSKKKFFKALKAHPKIAQIERIDDMVIGEVMENPFTSNIYHHKLVHIEPVQFFNDGMEIWTVGSTKKKQVLDFIKSTECLHKIDVMKIELAKMTNISVLSISPNLTEMQRKAVDLAVDKGYYNIPRKIELKTLAKLMGVSYSTYQVHLRKAERKLIPHFLKRSI